MWPSIVSGSRILETLLRNKIHKPGHNLNSNAIIMTEHSVEKSNHVSFDDVKAACAILMSVDTKISQTKNMHQCLLLPKLKEISEITIKELEELALTCDTGNTRLRRSRRLISFSSSVDPERAMVNQEYSLN